MLPRDATRLTICRVNYVKVEVVRWVNHEWPGWIEVLLREADGTTTAIIEKVPVLLPDDLPATEPEIPSQIEIPCDVLERDQGTAGCTPPRTAALPHSGPAGRSVFRVPESDVTDDR